MSSYWSAASGLSHPHSSHRFHYSHLYLMKKLFSSHPATRKDLYHLLSYWSVGSGCSRLHSSHKSLRCHPQSLLERRSSRRSGGPGRTGQRAGSRKTRKKGTRKARNPTTSTPGWCRGEFRVFRHFFGFSRARGGRGGRGGRRDPSPCPSPEGRGEKPPPHPSPWTGRERRSPPVHGRAGVATSWERQVEGTEGGDTPCASPSRRTVPISLSWPCSPQTQRPICSCPPSYPPASGGRGGAQMGLVKPPQSDDQIV